MWHKRPPRRLESSSNVNLNFLFNSGKFYIMDNHRAASWCWLQEISTVSVYNFFHIDRHYDLLDHPIRVRQQVLDRNIDVSNLNLDEYLGLQEILRGGLEAKVFSWDNYIVNLLLIYPTLFNDKIFATHEESGENENYITRKINVNDIITEFENYLNEVDEHQLILNIDIDYFFQDLDGKYFEIFSDDDIEFICLIIDEYIDKIEVITIALSPECSGGWESAIRIAKIFSTYFELGFDINT